MPFEINRITIQPDGFHITFTKPVESRSGNANEAYAISAFTHPYHGAYGGPEIERHKAIVQSVRLAEDGLSARVTLDKLSEGFVYEFDLAGLKSRDQEPLLHRHAYYTVNEVPR